MCVTDQCYLERACDWHEEADVVTTTMEAVMLVAARGRVCCPWCKPSQSRSEEASWFSIWWALPNCVVQALIWGTVQKFVSVFLFLRPVLYPNSKCVLIFLKAVNCFAEWIPAGKINWTSPCHVTTIHCSVRYQIWDRRAALITLMLQASPRRKIEA